MGKENNYRLLPLDYLKSIGRFDQKKMNEVGFPRSMQEYLKSKERQQIKGIPTVSLKGTKVVLIQPRNWIIPRNWVVRV